MIAVPPLSDVAPADRLSGVRLPALSGPHDVRDALGILLKGTSLEVATDNGEVIVLRERAQRRSLFTKIAAADTTLAPIQLAQAAPPAPPTASEEIVVTGTRVVRDGREFGTFTNVIYRNTDVPERHYEGLLIDSRYRILNNLAVSGHWTVELKNEGNFEGEATNQPGISSVIHDFPEIYSEARHYPFGRLDNFQRHKIRLWAIYNLDLGWAGSVSIAPLWRYNSALEQTTRRHRVLRFEHTSIGASSLLSGWVVGQMAEGSHRSCPECLGRSREGRFEHGGAVRIG